MFVNLSGSSDITSDCGNAEVNNNLDQEPHALVLWTGKNCAAHRRGANLYW